jgi:hypothetical protein
LKQFVVDEWQTTSNRLVNFSENDNIDLNFKDWFSMSGLNDERRNEQPNRQNYEEEKG